MPTASTSDYTKCIWQSIINLLCHSINPHSFPFRSISVLPILHCGLSTGGMRYRGWTLDVNNQTKTERVLTGSRYNKLSLLGDCVPSLQLGCDSIAPSDGVWLLGVTTATDLSTDNCMCQTSVRRVSSGFVIWDVFVDHWTLSQLRHWLTLLLHRGSITAIAFLLLHRRESQTSCSLSMLQHPQGLQYKLAVTVHCCLQHWSPIYLTDYCVVNCLFHGFAAACLQAVFFLLSDEQSGWNSLPDDLWDSNVDSEHFRQVLKTFTDWTRSVSSLGVFRLSCSTIGHLLYLLTLSSLLSGRVTSSVTWLFDLP